MPERLELFECLTDRLQTDSRHVTDTSQHWLDTFHRRSTVKWFIHSPWSRHGHHPDMVQTCSSHSPNRFRIQSTHGVDLLQTLSRQVPDTFRHISGKSRNSPYIFCVPDIVKTTSRHHPDIVLTMSRHGPDTINTACGHYLDTTQTPSRHIL